MRAVAGSHLTPARARQSLQPEAREQEPLEASKGKQSQLRRSRRNMSHLLGTRLFKRDTRATCHTVVGNALVQRDTGATCHTVVGNALVQKGHPESEHWLHNRTRAALPKCNACWRPKTCAHGNIFLMQRWQPFQDARIARGQKARLPTSLQNWQWHKAVVEADTLGSTPLSHSMKKAVHMLQRKGKGKGKGCGASLSASPGPRAHAGAIYFRAAK